MEAVWSTYTVARRQLVRQRPQTSFCCHGKCPRRACFQGYTLDGFLMFAFWSVLYAFCRHLPAQRYRMQQCLALETDPTWVER
jgi:hypothetical protein